MKRSVPVLLFLLVAGPAFAQEATALNETQKHGQQLFAQSCGICHLPPELGARTYGPPLNKNAGGGDDDVMRQYITEGTPRMPSFKAYVRTVPAPAAAPAR